MAGRTVLMLFVELVLAGATADAESLEAKAQAKNWVKVALLGNAKVRARARPGPQYALCCARARS